MTQNIHRQTDRLLTFVHQNLIFWPTYVLLCAALWNIPRWWFVCCCCPSWCLNWCFFFFLSHRLHGWWKWAFPGLMPLRPSELQITTSTWQPTSSCNTERESSARKTEVNEDRERKQKEKQPKQRSKKQKREKILKWINDSEWWIQTIFVQIIWRLSHCSLKQCWADPTWTEPDSRLINEEVWSTKWKTFAS